MAEEKKKKKEQKVVAIANPKEYFATWGPKGFLTTPKKVVPFWDLKTSYSLKDNSGNKKLAPTEAQRISFKTKYAYALGTDPRAQMYEWWKLVGMKFEMYVGGEQFGSPLLMLENVKWSNMVIDKKGTIISAEAEIFLVEWFKGIELSQGWFTPEQPKQTQAGMMFGGNISNQEKIWNFLRSQGFSAAATAGVIGNYEAECGCNPDSEEIPNGYGTHGYGLAQWTNTGYNPATGTYSSPRRTELFNWCSANGKNVKLLETQLEYMMVEYNNKYAAYIKQNSGYDYKTITDVWTATDTWLTWYEGCTVRTEVVQWPRRIAEAKRYYGMWKNYTIVPHAQQGVGVVPGDGVSTGSYTWPVPGRPCDITTHGGHINEAGDFPVPQGSTIVAIDGGVVAWTHRFDGFTLEWNNNSYGNCVCIRHANNGSSLYAHMYPGSIKVKPGQKVSKGQPIGIVGNTGTSYGAHLHMEIKHKGVYIYPKYIGWQNRP